MRWLPVVLFAICGCDDDKPKISDQSKAVIKATSLRAQKACDEVKKIACGCEGDVRAMNICATASASREQAEIYYNAFFSEKMTKEVRSQMRLKVDRVLNQCVKARTEAMTLACTEDGQESEPATSAASSVSP